MSDLHTLLATAKDEFSKHRVNKAVEALIKAVELIVGEAPKPGDKQTLTEPAPAPTKEPLVEQPPETPADAPQTPAQAAAEQTEGDPAPKAAKRPKGTRTDDVAAAPGSIVVS